MVLQSIAGGVVHVKNALSVAAEALVEAAQQVVPPQGCVCQKSADVSLRNLFHHRRYDLARLWARTCLTNGLSAPPSHRVGLCTQRV